LDQTLEWTQQQLASRYGQPTVELTPEQSTTSAALLWLLKGDAAQRIVTAWHFGWPPAWEASGSTWLAPFVARLLDDPYGVVRYVSNHALKELPGFTDFAYDFLAPSEQRRQAVTAAIDRWRRQTERHPSWPHAKLLALPSGELDETGIERLLQSRDNRPVTIKE
jgi:hypothetical protein